MSRPTEWMPVTRASASVTARLTQASHRRWPSGMTTWFLSSMPCLAVADAAKVIRECRMIVARNELEKVSSDHLLGLLAIK